MTTAPRLARLASTLPRALRESKALARAASLAPPLWLRPRGNNLGDMRFLVARALREGRTHVQMMIHSSELMPGGSPTFPDRKAVDGLYADVTALLDGVIGRVHGSTFADFRAEHAPPPRPVI